MPEPFDKWSTDYPIYKYITNPLAKHMCFLHPNIVTLTGGLIIIPIVKNIIQNGSRIELVFWMMLRALFDCLDGSVARICNKSTSFGSFLDTVVDSILASMIAIAFIYIIFKHKLFGPLHIISALILVVVSVVILSECYLEATNNQKQRFSLKVARFIHDNTVVASIIQAIAINALIKTPLWQPL